MQTFYLKTFIIAMCLRSFHNTAYMASANPYVDGYYLNLRRLKINQTCINYINKKFPAKISNANTDILVRLDV